MNTINIFSKKTDIINKYKKLNPTYNIIVHDSYTKINQQYNNSLQCIKKLCPRTTHASIQYDFLRLSILQQNNGGWWLDTARTLFKPLNDIIKEYNFNGKKLIYFYTYCNTISNNVYIPQDYILWDLIYQDILSIENISNEGEIPKLYITELMNKIEKFYPDYIYKIDIRKIDSSTPKIDFCNETKISQEVAHSWLGIKNIPPPIINKLRPVKKTSITNPQRSSIMYDKEKNSPEVIEMIKRYTNAQVKWYKAGKPLRTDEEIKEIFSICQSCQHFKKDLIGSKCNICGCRLHSTRKKVNKIAMSTESCPDNPPRWNAKITTDKKQ